MSITDEDLINVEKGLNMGIGKSEVVSIRDYADMRNYLIKSLKSALLDEQLALISYKNELEKVKNSSQNSLVKSKVISEFEEHMYDETIHKLTIQTILKKIFGVSTSTNNMKTANTSKLGGEDTFIKRVLRENFTLEMRNVKPKCYVKTKFFGGVRIEKDNVSQIEVSLRKLINEEMCAVDEYYKIVYHIIKFLRGKPTIFPFKIVNNLIFLAKKLWEFRLKEEEHRVDLVKLM